MCQKRGITVSEDALRIIAANADGSVRDGLSILDQCISGGETEVSSREVLDFLGASGEETFTELTELVRKEQDGEMRWCWSHTRWRTARMSGSSCGTG